MESLAPWGLAWAQSWKGVRASVQPVPSVLETKMVNGMRTGQGAASDRSRALCQHFLPLVPPPHWPLGLRAAFGVGEGLPPLMLEFPQRASCSLVTSVPSPLSVPQAG